MSWEQPARLAPFAADSPFAGLAIPADVTVSRQVLAEPDLDLAGQDLGAARRRDAARHRREARAGLDRAGAHDGQRRLVEPRPLGAVRRDAAAGRGGEPRGGRGRQRGVAAARDLGRVRPPAAGAALGAPDPGRRDRHGCGVAAPSAGLLRHGRRAPRPQPVGRDQGIEADREPAARHRARDLRARPRDRSSPAAAVGGAAAGARRFVDRLRPARPLAPAQDAGRGPGAARRRGAADDGAGRRRLCRAGDLGAAPRLCPHRERGGRCGEPRRARRPDRHLEPAHRGRHRRAAGDRHRKRRADLLSAALLAGDGRPAAAFGQGHRADQPLPRNRRDDPLRHPRRRQPEPRPVRRGCDLGATAAAADGRGQDAAAGPDPARPRADQVVLSDARVPRPLECRDLVGRAGRGPRQ